MIFLAGKVTQPGVGRAQARFMSGLRHVFHPAQGDLDLSGYGAATNSGTGIVRKVVSPIGVGNSYGGSSTDGQYFPTTSNATYATVLIYAHITSTGATRGLAQWAQTTASEGLARLIVHHNSGSLQYYWNSGYQITETGVAPAGTSHAIVVVMSPSGITVFRNGALRGRYLGGSSNTGNNVWFGNGYNGSAFSVVTLGAWWETALDFGSAMLLSRTPYALIKSKRHIPVYTPSAAVGGFKAAWARNSNHVIGVGVGHA